MGCTYANGIQCPYTGCIGWPCPYYLKYTSAPTVPDISYMPSMAKHIHEFTTDELLAEIRRRCGT